jgi:hypothetical protein
MLNHQQKEDLWRWLILSITLMSVLSACELTERKSPIEQIFDMGEMSVVVYDEAVCQNLITMAENQCCTLIKSLKTNLDSADSKKISICSQNEQVACIDQNEKSAWFNQIDLEQKDLSQEDQNQLQIEACALATDTLKAYQLQFKECAPAVCQGQADLVFAQNISCVTVDQPTDPSNDTMSQSDDLAPLSCGLDDVILNSVSLYPSAPLLDLVENRFELLPTEIDSQVAPQLAVSLLTIDDLQQPVDHFNLSLSSDFFSNLFARGGLRPALSVLFEQDLEDRFSQPWQCQVDPLKCQSFFSNLIKSALEVKISQIRDQINIGLQAVLPENAFESPSLQSTQNQSLRLDLRSLSVYSGEVELEKGSVLIENTKPTALRFDQAHFRLLATHTPNPNNSDHALADAHQWINQAELLWNISKDQCETLASDNSNAQIREKRSILSSPYRCRCSAPAEQIQLGGDWQPYCVTDPYPYPQGKGDLSRLSAESHMFLCDQKGSYGLAPDRIGSRLSLNQGNWALLKSFISDDLNQFACQSLVGTQGVGDQQLIDQAQDQGQGQGQGQKEAFAFGEYAAFELKIPIEGGAMRARMMGDQKFSVKAKFPLYQQWQRDSFEFKFDQSWQKVQAHSLLPIEQEMELLFDLQSQSSTFALSAKDQSLTIHGVLRYQSSEAGKSQIAGIRRIVLDSDTMITQTGDSLKLDPNAQNLLCRLSGSLENADRDWIVSADNYEALKNQSETCDRSLANQMVQLITQRINEHFLYRLSDQIKSLYHFSINQALFAKVQGGVWTNLINEITSAVWLSPLKLFKYVDEQVAQDLQINPLTTAQLWGPSAMLCASHLAPDLACPLVAKALGNRNSDILRIHTQQFSVFDLDEKFPPVDFCDSEQLRNLDLRNRLIKKDLLQKDEDDPIEATGVFAQCSIQVKQSLSTQVSDDLSLFGGVAKLKFIPTKQTELLINRALTCRTLAHCSPDIPDSVLDDADQLADRTHLALCSLLSNFWYQPAQDQAWRSLVDVLKDSQLSENQSMIAALLEDFGLNPVQGARDFNARFANCKTKLNESNILISEQPKRRAGSCEDGLVDTCIQESFCADESLVFSCENQMCLVNGMPMAENLSGENSSSENLSCLAQTPDLCVARQDQHLLADRSYEENPNGQNANLETLFEKVAMTGVKAQDQDESLAIVGLKQQQIYFAMAKADQGNAEHLALSSWQMVSAENTQASMLDIQWSTALNQGVILWINLNLEDQTREIAFRFFDAMGVLDSQTFQISARHVTKFKSLWIENVLYVLYDDELSKQLKVWTYHPTQGIQSTLIAQNTLPIFDLSVDGSVVYASPYGKVWFKARSNHSLLPDYQTGSVSLETGIQDHLIDLQILPRYEGDRMQGHLVIESLQNEDQSIRLESKAITQTGRFSATNTSSNIGQLYDQGSGFLYTRSMIHPLQNIEIKALHYQVYKGDGTFDRDGGQLVFPIELNYPKIDDAKLFDGAENLWIVWLENQRGLRIGRYPKTCLNGQNSP